tara:strand:- start:1069 stop:1938 length:870 start_codon:yes stop_codon:yes gene_type:complete
MKRSIYFLSICLLITCYSCKKDNLVYIEGNQIPPDKTIENITKENYVNKLYISALGRQATPSEFSNGLLILNKNNLSLENRKELVDTVLADNDYYNNEYSIIRGDLLNGLDTTEISKYIKRYKNTLLTTNDQNKIDRLTGYIERLYLMQDIITDLRSDSITFKDVHKRCVFNRFYDEINMGTENFVVSMYQNFFYRYPTSSELITSSNMVNGIQAILFFKAGQTKEEFIDLFLGSDEYYEGQIRLAYLRFVFREPTVIESTHMTGLYKVDLDYKSMQKRILISDEYVGL